MKHKDIRVTGPLLKVLQQFLACPAEPLSGADLAQNTKISSGTLYPLLRRLEEAKWLKSTWEEAIPQEIGRPRRRLYRITGLGTIQSRKALCETFPDVEVPAWLY